MYVCRARYIISKCEDILIKQSDTDMKEGLCQVQVNEKSSNIICTFNSGRYGFH